ncbi:type IX secretion system anionic LPS delivery protein PorZ [Flavobacterium algicola]|uniref:type IX secretion system anionic LPS delivery protein PorZ n=1 Tax=Flavobacterium algicola TaxID=556529 RepID=UPI001EFCAE7D|nr:T9SS type A sorting domain-containing protein [Flavobacterium algicola]MCG9792023.1 T9SS type A sorting domain-containing protein [Flavobacterium algicola]
MKKIVLTFLILIIGQMCWSQSNLSWQGYFSYNEIKDLSTGSNTVFAASENALFSKNLISNEIKTTNTIDGLSGETISAIYHSTFLNKTVLGYQNGLITVINDADGTILKVVDILNKQLPSTVKKINHFMEYQGIIYISCDFGIVQFNLNSMLFGDTYFIGDNGAEISVTQTAVFDGFLYAATSVGIRRADATNKNLIDFNQWKTLITGSWTGIELLSNDLVAVNTAGSVHKYNSNTFVVSGINLNQLASDMRVADGYLLLTTASSVFVYNQSLILIRQINSDAVPTGASFSCATVVGDRIYFGTTNKGMFATSISSGGIIESNTPSGPSLNNIFAIDASSTSLWAVYGGYSSDYNPYPIKSYGISKFDQTGWLNIPYEEIKDIKSTARVVINPSNEKEVFVMSYFSGLLKITDDIPTLVYTNKNSDLQDISFIANYANDVRIEGGTFDKSGNLWVNNSLVKNGIKVLNTNGSWQSFSTESILDDYQKCSFGRIAIDKLGTKWMATSTDGIIGFNEKGSVFKKISVGDDAGNLPIKNARVAVPDNNNQLWIGTISGLRIVSNINTFFTDAQLTTKPIIILEEGVAQELMYEQFITDIVVDGANNKWIGTADSGIFLVSPDGQTTLHHFTTTNSPLPSNIINDVAINGKTGEVFMATSKGMISFKGVATKANSDLSNAYVYPNPVRPGYEGTVKIAGLIDNANIKITDIEGNLVYETTSEGGTIEWDTTAFGKYKVATGVYIIFISADDGIETKVKKVMIVR